MTIQTLLKMGDPRLLQMAQPVTEGQWGSPQLMALVADLWETMDASNGAGLAAPQIGVDWQVVVFGTGKVNPRYPDAPLVDPTVLCNPVIIPLDSQGGTQGPIPEEVAWEGCLSVPGMRGQVPRASHIRYTGFDAMGRAIDRVVSGFHARVVQHECDHLWGTLYPMRIRDMRQFGFNEVLFPQLT